MLIGESIKLGIMGIANNKMRAFLTMLGIIIGIGSVIAIMTVSYIIRELILKKLWEDFYRKNGLAMKK